MMLPKCDRCGCETKVLTGSYFNNEMICIPCDEKEQEHPKYAEAKQEEHFQVLRGNYNFPGIGLPKDLKYVEDNPYEL